MSLLTHTVDEEIGQFPAIDKALALLKNRLFREHLVVKAHSMSDLSTVSVVKANYDTAYAVEDSCISSTGGNESYPPAESLTGSSPAVDQPEEPIATDSSQPGYSHSYFTGKYCKHPFPQSSSLGRMAWGKANEKICLSKKCSRKQTQHVRVIYSDLNDPRHPTNNTSTKMEKLIYTGKIIRQYYHLFLLRKTFLAIKTHSFGLRSIKQKFASRYKYLCSNGLMNHRLSFLVQSRCVERLGKGKLAALHNRYRVIRVAFTGWLEHLLLRKGN